MDLSPRVDQAAPAPPRRRGKRWPAILVLALVIGGGVVIVTQFLSNAIDYYCNVDEVGTRSGCDADRRLRLQGVVERGSIVEEGGDTEFLMGFNGATIPVHYDGEPGGIFKECIAVVVHGTFDPDEVTANGPVFLGDRVEVKHSDEYVAVNDERLDEVGDIEDACESGATA